MGDDTQDQDCAVCLQKCDHPTQLPCGHVFCFLCVKGVAIRSRKCAMCRAKIPTDYLDHPVLLEKLSARQGKTEEQNSVNQWYYEGRNGWWKYDERSNIELETAFNRREAECTLLLAGALYSIDFQSMTQVRCSDETRRRRVRRDTPVFPSKGVAGVKACDAQPIEQRKRENTDHYVVNSHHNRDNIIEILDDDDDDDDVGDEVSIIQSTEPVIVPIIIDDVSDEFERLNIINVQEPES